MCTGRIDPAMVAGAFKKGLDGLMVVGCYFGDCHYITGNYQAQAKVDITQKLFDYIGVNKNRLVFRQCSSGEASVFVKLVSEFDAKIKELGPIGKGGDRLKAPEIFEKLNIAKAVLAGEKIRWVIGKRTPFIESGNIYGEVFTKHEFNRAIDMIIVEETEVQEILNQLKNGAQSVRNLSEDLDIPAERVFRYVTALLRKELIRLDNVAERTPFYQLADQKTE
jgi:F420-non-reducing hydrogenase iron-sulfur subunit